MDLIIAYVLFCAVSVVGELDKISLFFFFFSQTHFFCLHRLRRRRRSVFLVEKYFTRTRQY